MANLNPYESPVGFQPERPEISSRSSRKWAIIGFLVGAVIPIVWGIYVLRADAVYQASLPEMERNMCGNGALAIMILMVIGSPTLETIGAAAGYVFSRLPAVAQ